MIDKNNWLLLEGHLTSEQFTLVCEYLLGNYREGLVWAKIDGKCKNRHGTWGYVGVKDGRYLSSDFRDNEEIITWEQFEEEFMKPTARDFRCFSKVAAVIGEQAAEWELGLVLENWGNHNHANSIPGGIAANSLMGAFNWEGTPQGHLFWSGIVMGRVPEKYIGTRRALEEAKVFGAHEAERERSFTEAMRAVTITPDIEELQKALAATNMEMMICPRSYILYDTETERCCEFEKLGEVLKAVEAKRVFLEATAGFV